MTGEKRLVLLVEDDLSFGAVLKSYLEISNFTVQWVDDGKYAIERFRNGKFHLCLLDVMLPNVDGFTIGKEIRAIDTQIPIIYLTAKSLKEDILNGYKIGADDYIVKPFDADVLLFRIAVLLKRSGNTLFSENQKFRIGDYLFDPKMRTIELNNQMQQLSPKESALLLLLCEHKNELLSREYALKRIWRDDDYFTTRSMDVFITKLRKYLKDDPSVEIKNIHGSGFIMNIP